MGKSTLLNCLLGQADPGERLVLVEDAPELDPQHPHVVRLVARPPNVEGIGEVRGAEVIDLLTALNPQLTAHDTRQRVG